MNKLIKQVATNYEYARIYLPVDHCSFSWWIFFPAGSRDIYSGEGGACTHGPIESLLAITNVAFSATTCNCAQWKSHGTCKCFRPDLNNYFSFKHALYVRINVITRTDVQMYDIPWVRFSVAESNVNVSCEISEELRERSSTFANYNHRPTETGRKHVLLINSRYNEH